MKRKILSDNRPKSRREIYFAYSIGMAQALFQLGLFVPAEEAVMSPVSGIFTHFHPLMRIIMEWADWKVSV